MYSLVTGASGVLGKAFCLELAKRGSNLFITGRSAEKLAALESCIKGEYTSAEVKSYVCDLTDAGQRQALFAAAEGLNFTHIINCAGADIQKPLEEYTQQKLTFQARVNFEAAAAVCLFAVQNGGDNLKIINISSISGETPMPDFAVYSAAKGALTSFSIALNRELKGSGRSCTAVVAGAFYSRPDVVEYIKTQGLWGKIAAKTPDFVVKKSLKAADKGRGKYVVGGANKFMNALLKLLPSKTRLWYIKKRWGKTRKDAF